MSALFKRSMPLILVALTFPTLITWIYFVALRGSPPHLQQLAYSFGKAIQFTIPIWWVTTQYRGEWREAWSRIVLLWWAMLGKRETGSPPITKGVGIGIAFGLVIAAAMWLLYAYGFKPTGFFTLPQEQVRSKVTGMGIDSLAKYAALGVFYSLGHSLLEEYYWRWFVFREIRRTSSISVAIVASSIGFMLHHIVVLATFFGWTSWATWLFSGGVAVGGAFWGWLYDRSQSLLGPWISHCLVDAAIFLIGYDLIRDLFQ